NKSGLDGQFAVAAVDQYTELNAPGTPMVEQSIHGGTNGAPGIKNVIHKDHILFPDFHTQRSGFLNDRAAAHGGKVIAVQGNVEGANGDRLLLNLVNQLSQPLGQGNATALDSDQRQILDSVVLFHDLVGQPDQGTFDLRGGHDASFLAEVGKTSGSAGSHSP